MDFKSIFLALAVCIATNRKCIVQSEFVDIVLFINDSNQNNYTRFINVTHQHFLWLSSVLCDNNTYSYSITFDTYNGSVVSYSSTTFMAQNVEPGVYRKEFTCTSLSTVFQCTRLPNNSNCDDVKISWMYLNTDTSSTCPDKCIRICSIYPIQSIIITYETQPSKNSNNAECQNTIPQQTSTLKLNPTFTSTPPSPSSSDNSKNTSPDDSLPVIIGASIGGGVFIIIAIIVFLVCLKKRRKQKLKNTKQTKHNFDNSKENDISTKKQLSHIDEVDKKRNVSDITKAKCVNKLSAQIDCTEAYGSNNVNANIATYSCVETDAMKAREKDYNISEINTDPRQFQPSEFSNPDFSGSGMDYSSIIDLHSEINNNVNNNGGINTRQPSNSNECGNNYSTLGDNTRSLAADTYSTLGEKARSVSDTYNVMPSVSHKKGHTSLAAISDYDNNRGNSSNVNLGDNVGQVDGAPNDVYAQVIKPLRKVNLKE